MTSTVHHSTTGTSSAAPSRTPLLLALGVASGALLTAVGTFLDLTGNEPTKTNDAGEVGAWAFCVALSALAAAVAFGVVVRGAARGNAGRRSLVTSLVGVVTLAAFWTGIPTVLVAASVGCALVDRDGRGSFSAMSKAGLVVSAVVTALAVLAAIAG